jgi:geranylgeranyl diphosphate synthase type II
MQQIQAYAKLLDQALGNLKLGSEPEKLYAPMHYIIGLGGKRLRPALTLIACELFGGDKQDALKPALGIELFHNFSLVHDDIMDKADLRRGEPTVHKKWDGNIGILSGDGMLVKAYEHISAVSPEKLPAVLSCFSKMAMEVCEGQQFDMDFEQRQDVTEAEYINMIRLKTSVLLGAALKIGAILGNASLAEQEALYNFGVNIGIAFQIQDDILDSFGDPEKFGKTVGGDIMNNKQTLLLIAAKELADNNERHSLISVDNLDPADKVEAVKGLYEITGALAYAEQKRDAYYTKSLDALDKVNQEHPLLIELSRFAKQLVHRDR